jgi:hypothetical protein
LFSAPTTTEEGSGEDGEDKILTLDSFVTEKLEENEESENENYSPENEGFIPIYEF